MRTAVVGLLIFFLGSCPIWCATFEASLGLPCSHDASHSGANRDPAAPSPVNNDDCVCNGAILVASPEHALAGTASPPLFPSPFDITLIGPFAEVALPLLDLLAAGFEPGPGWGQCAPSLERCPLLRC